MIGYLEGCIHNITEEKLLIVVSGVGYEVACTTTLIQSLAVGDGVTVYVQHIIKEDSQSLYGFPTLRQKQLFQLLLGAQGVGPKLALSLLSGMTEEQLLSAIQSKHVHAFKSIKGVGVRLAEKLVVDLAPKISKWHPSKLVASGDLGVASTVVHQAKDEAIMALQGLGYTSTLIHEKVGQLFQEGMSTQQLLKTILQSLGQVC